MTSLKNEHQLFSSKDGTAWFPHLDGKPRADIGDWLHQNLTWSEFQAKSTEELQEIETQWRDSQLKSTDEFGLDDYPDNELRASMRAYRQDLRDYPNIEGFGDESLRPVDPRS